MKMEKLFGMGLMVAALMASVAAAAVRAAAAAEASLAAYSAERLLQDKAHSLTLF